MNSLKVLMDFPALIAALQNPELYPDHPRTVEVVQTHVSALFLTGAHVYKVKKPVDFGFLDFTTREKREFFCRQEVALNRRLCPEVYLGVVDIRLHQGRIYLGEGEGEVIEHAVFMRQLPQECMMDRLLARGVVTPALLHKIAAKIALFHSRAATSPEIASYGGMETIQKNVEENFGQTERYVGLSLSTETFQEIKENTLRFLQAKLPLFDQRRACGKIRDCHGDLHLQHICLADEILIFDCIEFNDRFRYSDVAADIAFLLMDLEFHGYPLFSADLASCYLRISRDWPLFRLLNFYKAYRAYVRGKVISFRWDDPGISAREKTSSVEEAGRYFNLARHYAQRMNRPALAITSGLIGTGKSTIARVLAAALGGVYVSSDILRKELAHLSPQTHRWEKFDQGVYAPDFTRQTYRALFDRARATLSSGLSVVLDASFKKESDRREARSLACQAGADFILVECRCPEEEIRKRLDHRQTDEKESSDGRWEIFAEQKRDFENVEGWSPDLHLPLDTCKATDDCLEIILRYLLRREGRELSGPLNE